METLRSLIDRLSSTNGWERELDAAIHTAFPDATRGQPVAFREDNCTKLPRYHDGWRMGKSADDDALGLLERALPDTSVDLTANRKGRGVRAASARIWSDNPPLSFGDPRPIGFGNATTPAVALCIALLKAAIARDDNRPSHRAWGF